MPIGDGVSGMGLVSVILKLPWTSVVPTPASRRSKTPSPRVETSIRTDWPWRKLLGGKTSVMVPSKVGRAIFVIFRPPLVSLAVSRRKVPGTSCRRVRVDRERHQEVAARELVGARGERQLVPVRVEVQAVEGEAIGVAEDRGAGPLEDEPVLVIGRGRRGEDARGIHDQGVRGLVEGQLPREVDRPIERAIAVAEDPVAARGQQDHRHPADRRLVEPLVESDPDRGRELVGPGHRPDPVEVAGGDDAVSAGRRCNGLDDRRVLDDVLEGTEVEARPAAEPDDRRLGVLLAKVARLVTLADDRDVGEGRGVAARADRAQARRLQNRDELVGEAPDRLVRRVPRAIRHAGEGDDVLVVGDAVGTVAREVVAEATGDVDAARRLGLVKSPASEHRRVAGWDGSQVVRVERHQREQHVAENRRPDLAPGPVDGVGGGEEEVVAVGDVPEARVSREGHVVVNLAGPRDHRPVVEEQVVLELRPDDGQDVVLIEVLGPAEVVTVGLDGRRPVADEDAVHHQQGDVGIKVAGRPAEGVDADLVIHEVVVEGRLPLKAWGKGRGR